MPNIDTVQTLNATTNQHCIQDPACISSFTIHEFTVWHSVVKSRLVRSPAHCGPGHIVEPVMQ